MEKKTKKLIRGTPSQVSIFILFCHLKTPCRKRSPLIRTTTKSEKEGNRRPRTQNPSTLPSRLQKPYQTPNAPRLLLYIFHRELLEQIEDNKREKTERRQEDGIPTLESSGRLQATKIPIRFLESPLLNQIPLR